MFDFQNWIEIFKGHYQEGSPYNDTSGMVSLDNPSKTIEITGSDNLLWKVLGIHHLSPEENHGNHNVYIEVLCKQNEREAFKAIHWTWVGRRPNQNAPDVFAGQKPLHELVNIPINLGMVVSVWPHLGETVKGISSFHDDEGNGNTIGHHSFFVCFQEMEIDSIPPEPEPEPEPPIDIKANVRVVANLDWLKTLPVDANGNITFITGNKGE